MRRAAMPSAPACRKATPARSCSEPPRKFSIDTALNLRSRRVGRTIFGMTVVQQILSGERELELFAGMPCQTRIQFEVAGHRCGYRTSVGVQGVDPAQAGVEFRAPRQVQRGTYGELVLGVRRFEERV